MNIVIYSNPDKPKLSRAFFVDVVPKIYIGIKTTQERYVKGVFTEVSYDKLFGVGDAAEYDSYNLSYWGYITKITEKTVTIQERNDSSRRHRLSLRKFVERNYKFDLDEIAAKNAETMMYI